MNLDEETLLEIEDYIKHLDEKFGLKYDTMLDIESALTKYHNQIKKDENNGS